MHPRTHVVQPRPCLLLSFACVREIRARQAAFLLDLDTPVRVAACGVLGQSFDARAVVLRRSGIERVLHVVARPEIGNMVVLRVPVFVVHQNMRWQVAFRLQHVREPVALELRALPAQRPVLAGYFALLLRACRYGMSPANVTVFENEILTQEIVDYRLRYNHLESPFFNAAVSISCRSNAEARVSCVRRGDFPGFVMTMVNISELSSLTSVVVESLSLDSV